MRREGGGRTRAKAPPPKDYLIETLLKLNPTDTERTKARHTIIEALLNNNPGDLYSLVGLLRQLTPVHDWLAALGIKSA